MSFVPALMTGLSAASGLLGNLGQKNTRNTTQNLSPEQQALYNQLLTQQSSMMNGPDLTGYEAGQTNDINHIAELHKKNLMETLAARGISGPATNYAADRVDNGRFADITKLHQQIPLMKFQYQQDALNSGANILRAVAPGSTTTESTPGNPLGGLVGGGSSALAFLYGQGAFKPQQNNYPQGSSYIQK